MNVTHTIERIRTLRRWSVLWKAAAKYYRHDARMAWRTVDELMAELVDARADVARLQAELDETRMVTSLEMSGGGTTTQSDVTGQTTKWRPVG